jgi:hypothetical protein
MMTEHELETIKADAIHTENNAYNPYGILTDEELQLMQAFEGKREKALTRKVCRYESSDLSPPKGGYNRILNFILISFFRSIFEFCPSLRFSTFYPMSTVPILEMQKLKG